jgi:hypothetical protein
MCSPPIDGVMPGRMAFATGAELWSDEGRLRVLIAGAVIRSFAQRE